MTEPNNPETPAKLTVATNAKEFEQNQGEALVSSE